MFAANFLIALNYFITDGINGAATCFLGAILTIINYFFNRKDKKIPTWLNVCYLIVLTTVNIIVAEGISWLGLLVIFASFAFIMSVAQENGKAFRFWTVLNVVTWCVYDMFAGLYAPLMQHTLHLLFTVAGMVIFDLKRKKEI